MFFDLLCTKRENRTAPDTVGINPYNCGWQDYRQDCEDR